MMICLTTSMIYIHKLSATCTDSQDSGKNLLSGLVSVLGRNMEAALIALVDDF